MLAFKVTSFLAIVACFVRNCEADEMGCSYFRQLIPHVKPNASFPYLPYLKSSHEGYVYQIWSYGVDDTTELRSYASNVVPTSPQLTI